MKNEQIAILVEKVQKDKSTYFEELYEATWSTVYYYCYKTLGNEHDAKDAMQTVFIELYKKLDTLYHPNAFNSFLATLMRYTCSNYLRAKLRNTTDDIDDHEATLPEDNTEFLPKEAFEKEEVRREIAKLVESLPEKQREAILLFYFKEKSIKEIAEITESKFDAVNNRLVVARKTLRERAEALIKEGMMDKVMAGAPVPILTRILLEEAQQIATPEIGELVWRNISKELDIPTQTTAPHTAATATTTASTTAVTGINVGIIAVAIAVLAAVAVLAYYINDNFFNQPAPEAVAYFEAEPFNFFIPDITNRVQFVEFTDTHGFRFLGGSRTSYSGSQMLYYLQYRDYLIHLGYIEDLQNNFQVVYQITDNNAPRITTEEIATWFTQHK